MMMGVAFGLVATFAFILLVTVYMRREMRERGRFAQMQTDLSDMTALFRTMRDVITQQKALAREFNDELEKKMNLVKQVLARGMEKNERLYERQQELEARLTETAARLDALQRQARYLGDYTVEYEEGMEDEVPPPPHPFAADGEPDAAAEFPAPTDEASTVPSKPQSPAAPRAQRQPAQTQAAQTRPAQSPPARPQAARTPAPPTQPAKMQAPRPPATSSAATPPSKESFSDWAELKLGDEGPASAAATPATAARPAVSGEEHSSARDAFRALLDLGPDGAAQKTENEGNGRNASAPLQRRVLEYEQAGMNVGDIARELGIGKGEVRLMLSLARQNRS